MPNIFFEYKDTKILHSSMILIGKYFEEGRFNLYQGLRAIIQLFSGKYRNLVVKVKS